LLIFDVTVFGVKVAFSLVEKREYVKTDLNAFGDAEHREQTPTVGVGRNVT